MSNRAVYLKELGIDIWVERDVVRLDPTIKQAVSSAAPTPDWEELARQVSSCTKCDLHSGRTQTVFGTGNRGAELMIIGEAPGAEEDKRGEPFVGRAGQLLNSMLLALDYKEKIYLSPIFSNADRRITAIPKLKKLMRALIIYRPRLHCSSLN